MNSFVAWMTPRGTLEKVSAGTLMNWTTQQKIRLGFWLLLFVPIVLSSLAIRNAYELADAARHVANTNDIGACLPRSSAN